MGMKWSKASARGTDNQTSAKEDQDPILAGKRKRRRKNMQKHLN